ncbi:MAG: serine/threonine-protein kinase [Acidobacteriota bacterium]
MSGLQQIGPYELRRRLATGGMSEVWEGWDSRLHRNIAIKLVDRTSARSEREARRRLLREARAVAALDHPAIVRIHDVLEGDESDAIVMELVDGVTLRHHIERNGVLGEREALVLAFQVVEALAAAHAGDVVHRDLKSENVMVDERGRVKILDFGLAKRLENTDSGTFTYSGRILGTVRTMSPQQVVGDEIDERTDLFSLGVLLYECLTGISPFSGKDLLDTIQRISQHRQASVRSIHPEVSVETSSLVDHLLEKSPDDRPQSATEVRDTLGELIGSGEVPSPSGDSEESESTGSDTKRKRAGSDDGGTDVASAWTPLLLVGALVVIALLIWLL